MKLFQKIRRVGLVTEPLPEGDFAAISLVGEIDAAAQRLLGRASPRHADLLLVTGPVTRNMEIPLRKTYEATPDPKLVVAVGDCARDCGVFAGSYAVVGGVNAVVPVDVIVSGCPPSPADILRGILVALGRLHLPATTASARATKTVDQR